MYKRLLEFVFWRSGQGLLRKPSAWGGFCNEPPDAERAGRHCCAELLADLNGLFLSRALPADKSAFPYRTSCLWGNDLSAALELRTGNLQMLLEMEGLA